MVNFTHQEAGTAASDWQAAGLGEIAALDPSRIFEGVEQLIVIAAHPDDESLGAAGLIGQALRRGLEVQVLVCSFGEASHPQSPTCTAGELAAVRESELRTAMHALAAGHPGKGTLQLHCPGLPDGQLAAHQEHLADVLRQLIGERRSVLASTYRHEGHPDHEVLGRLAAAAAASGGLCHLEFPIWYWHWASPHREVHWRHWQALALGEPEQAAKRAALASHASQVQPLSAQPGDEVLLSAGFLEHFGNPAEIFRVTWPGHKDAAVAAEVFEALYAERPDPWDYHSSRYEQRKQELLLASLPAERYRKVLELGCSIGVQTAALAQHSDELLAVDASASALAQARKLLAGQSQVSLLQATLPGGFPQLPDGSLDLVVLSEIGYFLAADELAEVLQRCSAALAPGGELVLCHWLHPIEGWPLDGADVHRHARSLGWEAVVEHRERDFLLEILRKPGGAHA